MHKQRAPRRPRPAFDPELRFYPHPQTQAEAADNLLTLLLLFSNGDPVFALEAAEAVATPANRGNYAIARTLATLREYAAEVR